MQPLSWAVDAAGRGLHGLEEPYVYLKRTCRSWCVFEDFWEQVVMIGVIAESWIGLIGVMEKRNSKRDQHTGRVTVNMAVSRKSQSALRN